MYYAAKFFQAGGLGVIGVGFLTAFPDLIDINYLGAGALLFGVGWIIQHFLIQK